MDPLPAVGVSDFWLDIGIVVICIVLSACFSSAETALTATSRARIHAMEKVMGAKRVATVTRLLESRARLIGAMLLGNNIANIGSSALMTSVLVGVFGDRGVLYATGIMTFLLLVFAEVMPKTIAINHPERVSFFFGPAASVIVAVFGPLLKGVEVIVQGILMVFGVSLSEGRSILSGHDELKSTVDLLHREGGVERGDRDMFGGLLDLGNLTVEDVMIHRTKMRTINADLPPQEIVREALASPHTRLPLWRGQPDDIVGVLHAKELLRALNEAHGDAASLTIEDLAFETWFVPATTTLRDQLQAFLKRKLHFALVVDEYGEVMGLVTLEDILEEIVGDIIDEHDVAAQGVRLQPDGGVIVEGSVPIRDLNRVMNWSLPDDEATTIAGLVIHEAQAIPETGQIFKFHGFRFEVLRKTRNLLAQLRVSPMIPEDDAG
ncbi:HlyC/CorC family transporter [Lichenihabitans psoromatis]|uniref:HlyC/CorC family transporter n=1 Tax=Lichenihabitans psoromatis TaxID=2528642 RepID=UPI0010368BDD|nr:HlyC/CorC family transporter [Lichenihabitans psoromatis]